MSHCNCSRTDRRHPVLNIDGKSMFILHLVDTYVYCSSLITYTPMGRTGAAGPGGLMELTISRSHAFRTVYPPQRALTAGDTWRSREGKGPKVTVPRPPPPPVFSSLILCK